VDLLAAGNVRRLDHLVDIRRAEVLARIAELGDAAGVADIGVVDDQMRGLVFFVLSARVIQIGELVEGEFAIALHRTKELGAFPSIWRKLSRCFISLCPARAEYRAYRPRPPVICCSPAWISRG